MPAADVVLTLYFGGFAVWALFDQVKRRASRKKSVTTAWRRAAEACLTDVRWSSSHLGRHSDLEGRAGGLSVRFQACGKGHWGTRIVIGDARRGGATLTLRREDLATAARKRLGVRELQLGDRAFDDEVYIQGPPMLARAVLDTGTRLIVRRLLQGRIHRRGRAGTALRADVAFEDGELRAEITTWSERELDERLPEALRALLDAARRLSRPEDIAARLAHNVRFERDVAVRLQDVLTVAREYPDHPATREALRAALKDKDDEIVLRAAMALGEEGREALLQLASNHRAMESCAARAVAALRENLPPERSRTILRHALRERRVHLAGAVLEALGRGHDPEAVPTIARVLSLETGEVAVAAARALGASGLPAAERPLIEALARTGDELAVAAAQALGRAGSADAVLPLKEAMARRPEGHEDLHRAARQAIAEIQSRLTGAGPGQLSLPAADMDRAGRLSLVDGEAGRLSLAEGEPTDPSAASARARSPAGPDTPR